MSVPTLSETRIFDRALEYAREKIIPGITQNAIDALPGISLFAGRLGEAMFGPLTMMGRGKRMHTGGESIVNKVRLGVNTNRKTLTSFYDTFDTTPSDTVRHTRANWKLAGDVINISNHEIRTASGEFAIANIVQSEVTDGIASLVDLIGTHLFDAGGVASRLTDLNTIVSAGDTIHGLSGVTFPAWNSRGLSARGTAPGSVSFTGGSFATTGLENWRTAWSNAEEGTEVPDILLTTHDIKTFYEATLQPQERFNNNKLADAGFMVLQFKTAPVAADPHCNTGLTYFLNMGHIWLDVLSGADFSTGDFIEPEAQDVRIAKVVFTGEITTDARKLQNKVTTQVV